ncbi:MAG TPA: hypothetical protein VHO68_06905 [Bacteroidales bacterium]|nr:hypothetical protein [Bacteroidales bacterium]
MDFSDDLHKYQTRIIKIAVIAADEKSTVRVAFLCLLFPEMMNQIPLKTATSR